MNEEPLKGFRESIERVCEALRELRREQPEGFFGTSYETLYRSLDAALDNFYRSKANERSLQ